MVKTLNVEKDFLSNVDYLKSLVKEVKSKTSSDYDSNLIYEIIYADMYVTDLLIKVRDPKLVENINDIKIALDLIIADIPDDDVEKARSEVDYTKILKAKYGNVDDGSFEEEVAYNYVDDSQMVGIYLRKRKLGLVVLLIATILLVLSSRVYDMVLPIKGVSDVLISTNKLTRAVCSLILSLVIVFQTIGLSIDLMFIMFPAIRYMLDSTGSSKRLISIYAKASIEEFEGQLIECKKIKSYDRIKRNKYWLNSMIDNLKELGKQGVEIDKNFVDCLINLQSDLGNCVDRSKDWYRLIAKIEFLHDKYLNMLNSISLE